MSTACTFMPIALLVISPHGDSVIYSLFLANGHDTFPLCSKKAQAKIAVLLTFPLLSTVKLSHVWKRLARCLTMECCRVLPVRGSRSCHHLVDKGCFGNMFPHCVTEDDGGYYIQKGPLITPNIGCMLDDLRTYDNLSQFNPERFLTKDGKEPEITSNNLLRLW
ncbi:hypothetical protein EDB19DRAFT_1679107 [Suillus lakei]|nr:hypothetical protein EDB19DRAFT_1679107 [Suillus lakei]